MALTKLKVSKKIVGAIVAAIVAAAGVYGFVIDPEVGQAGLCFIVECTAVAE